MSDTHSLPEHTQKLINLWERMKTDFSGVGFYELTDIVDSAIQSEREKVVDLIRWELSDVLIKERETHGHINLAKYIKRLTKLAQKEEPK